MLKFGEFHFRKPALLTIAIVALALISVNASAQSEQEKVEENSPKPAERVTVDELESGQDNVPASAVIGPVRNNQVFKAPVKREAALPEKEPKKNESPSTLSFNIFLYVVDKFKED